MKFYRCKICGQIINKMNDKDLPVFCCGQPMEEIVACSSEGAVEKHLPVYQVKGNKVFVTVGSVPHPMTVEHFIEWIAIETKSGVQYKYLTSNSEPKACFSLCEGEEVVSVYAFCNLHSLWKA